MTPGQTRAICALAILVAASARTMSGADAVGPGELLATLPPTTNQTVLPLDGALKPAPGVRQWRLFVNDSTVFESTPVAGSSNTVLKIGLILRLGDNVVALESWGREPAPTPIERWTIHVHRRPPLEARQFAVLVQGQEGASAISGELDTFYRALVDHGMPVTNIRKAASWETLADTLSDFAKQTEGRDQVLIYYSGLGRLSRANTEPELMFSKSTPSAVVSLPVGNLIREAADLPSASVLLDISYAPSTVGPSGTTPSPRIASQQSPSGAAAPWLNTISSTSSVELAYTNPFVAASSAATRGFTSDFVDQWLATVSGASCNTLAGLAHSVATRNAQKPAAAWPLFYTRTPSSFRFCSPQVSTNLPALSISPAPAADQSPALRFVDVKIPAAAVPSELTVDGIPVSRRPGGSAKDDTDSQRVPVGPGRHVVDLITEAGSSSPRLSGATGVVSPASTDVTWSNDLTAELQLAAKVTSDTSIALSFIVGDHDNQPVRYELRNNGVIVLQDVVSTPSQLMRRQTVRRIPLAIGTNDIVLDVVHGGRYSSDRKTVVRRRAQPVRAVIVGVNAPAGAVPLASAEADARRVNDILLRYTDAVPASIRLLTGSGATHRAVRDAIAEFAAARTNRTGASADETFLFYFAGYGLSVETRGSPGMARCLLPSDFDPGRIRETCLSTDNLDDALDAVGRAVVIVDTSYDGRAGDHSRTYRTYVAPDATWRLTSGTDHPDRVFLVASGSNSAALESDDGGFFTLALETAIRGRLGKAASNGPPELSLLDAYERAREDASVRSGRRQLPVMKGVLSAPFMFVAKPVTELKQEAAAIEQGVRNDILAMRALDAAQLARAARLYDKVLSLDGADGDARLGRARVLLLQGDLAGARQAVDDGVRLSDDRRSESLGSWLLVRAELRMREGDIEAAIADAERSCAIDPSSSASAALLGMLYAVNGQHDRSLAQLKPVLARETGNAGTLTDEDLGRVLLHTYLSLRRSGQQTNARVLLASFSNTFEGKGRLLRLAYQNRVTSTLFPRRSNAVKLGQVGVQAPWSHVVAQFLRRGKKYEKTLYSFRTNVEPYDPRDGAAFECLLHFYVGIARTLDRDLEQARAEFQKVVDTRRIDYVEYWFARAEIARLTR
jgi:tetratricopeptide (TPR) repeat protein